MGGAGGLGGGAGGDGGDCGGDGSSLHDDWPSHVAHVLQLPPGQLVLDDCEWHGPEHEPPIDVQ